MAVTVKRRPLPRSFQIVADVGILERGSDAHGDKGPTIAEIATYHEFGLGVPQRSFIRGFYDSSRAVANGIISRRLKAMAGGLPPALAANQIAIQIAAECRKFITAGTNLEPLADETKKRKGSSKPLIDTGLLLSSIVGRGRVVSK